MLSLFLASVLAFGLSLGSALLADAYLTERVSVLGRAVGLTLSHNPGIAFGLRLPPVLQELLIGAAWIGVCILAWRSAHTRLLQTGYGFIIGGALGNIVDRIPDGRVTDFLQVGTFPVFNVADSFITIGALFVLAEMIRLNRNTQP